MLALIDGDVLVYQAGFASQKTCPYVSHDDVDIYFDHHVKKKDLEDFLESCENQNDFNINNYIIAGNINQAYFYIDNIIKSILLNVGTDEYKIFITASNDSTNFRKRIATIKPYKGNRAKAARPIHYEALREYLLTKWNATLVYAEEADDRLGIEQWRTFYTSPLDTMEDSATIICSIDKDLRMIPGLHYNISNQTKDFITEEEALRNFYKQMLTGDAVDNIPGIYGIGKARAEKILRDCVTEEEMYEAVLSAYYCDAANDDEVEQVSSRLLEIGRLLWIRRQENELWNPPERLV